MNLKSQLSNFFNIIMTTRISPLHSIFSFSMVMFFVFSGMVYGQKKKATGQGIGFSKLDGYVLKPESEPKPGVFFSELISRQVRFDELFKPEKGKKLKPIQFKNLVVVAGALPKTKLETNLVLEKIVKNKDILEVYFKKTEGRNPGNGKAPFCLYTTALDNSISGLDYYLNGKLEMELRN